MGDSAHVVAAEINQHQMLGDFFRVCFKLRFECEVFFFCVATPTSASQRTIGNNTILDTGENFRR